MASRFVFSSIMAAVVLLLPHLVALGAKAMLTGQLAIGVLVYSSLVLLCNRSFLFEVKATLFAKT
jgi:hypothetical protein